MGNLGKRLPTQESLAVLPAAMLVLFAAAARAGVVAPDFRTRANGFGFFDCGGGFTDDIAVFWAPFGRFG